MTIINVDSEVNQAHDHLMKPIRNIMTAPVVTSRVDAPLTEAIRNMHEHRVGSVVVVEDDLPMGIVTERDVLRVADSPRLGDLRVVDTMTAPAETIDGSLEVTAVLERMRERGYRHMPVTDDGLLVGIVSLRDLARIARIGPADVPRGLKGVEVTETSIGDVRGTEGFYHYRQYSAIDLARERPFEDVWMLLVDGRLPTSRVERDTFMAETAGLRAIPAALQRVLPAIASCSTPLEGLRSALSLAASARGCRPVFDVDTATRRADALFVGALTPSLLAALHRLGNGDEVVPPRRDLGHAANYLWMLTGTEPSPDHARALERYLIATIDHGFNASTFTGRVIASTGADMGACVIGAIGALSGPLHGGAPSRALDLLDEIGAAGRAREVVTRKVLAGERIMGFGHAVYRTEDPRSRLLRAEARALGGPIAELALAVEQTVVEVLAEHKPGRELYANVEFYAGVVMAACGIDPAMFTPTFAASRMVGWTANVLEQATDPKIIRPSARYVGPTPPRPVPLLG